MADRGEPGLGQVDLDGQALRLRHRDGGDRRGRAGPRRLRLRHRVPRRADDARREDHPDLRGHERDPARRDRPGDAGADGDAAVAPAHRLRRRRRAVRRADGGRRPGGLQPAAARSGRSRRSPSSASSPPSCSAGRSRSGCGWPTTASPRREEDFERVVAPRRAPGPRGHGGRARRDGVPGPRPLRRRRLRGARARRARRPARPPARARREPQRRGRHLRRRAPRAAPTGSTTATAPRATTSRTGSSSTATRCAATSATTPSCCASRSRSRSATSSPTTSASTSSACATSACSQQPTSWRARRRSTTKGGRDATARVEDPRTPRGPDLGGDVEARSRGPRGRRVCARATSGRGGGRRPEKSRRPPPKPTICSTGWKLPARAAQPLTCTTPASRTERSTDPTSPSPAIRYRRPPGPTMLCPDRTYRLSRPPARPRRTRLGVLPVGLIPSTSTTLPPSRSSDRGTIAENLRSSRSRNTEATAPIRPFRAIATCSASPRTRPDTCSGMVGADRSTAAKPTGSSTWPTRRRGPPRPCRAAPDEPVGSRAPGEGAAKSALAKEGNLAAERRALKRVEAARCPSRPGLCRRSAMRDRRGGPAAARKPESPSTRQGTRIAEHGRPPWAGCRSSADAVSTNLPAALARRLDEQRHRGRMSTGAVVWFDRCAGSSPGRQDTPWSAVTTSSDSS